MPLCTTPTSLQLPQLLSDPSFDHSRKLQTAPARQSFMSDAAGQISHFNVLHGTYTALCAAFLRPTMIQIVHTMTRTAESAMETGTSVPGIFS